MAGLVDKLHKMWNPPEDEYEDYYEDEQPEEESSSSRSSYSEPAAPLPIPFLYFASFGASSFRR